jgi:hypothetical protein
MENSIGTRNLITITDYIAKNVLGLEVKPPITMSNLVIQRIKLRGYPVLTKKIFKNAKSCFEHIVRSLRIIGFKLYNAGVSHVNYDVLASHLTCALFSLPVAVAGNFIEYVNNTSESKMVRLPDEMIEMAAPSLCGVSVNREGEGKYEYPPFVMYWNHTHMRYGMQHVVKWLKVKDEIDFKLQTMRLTKMTETNTLFNIDQSKMHHLHFYTQVRYIFGVLSLTGAECHILLDLIRCPVNGRLPKFYYCYNNSEICARWAPDWLRSLYFAVKFLGFELPRILYKLSYTQFMMDKSKSDKTFDFILNNVICDWKKSVSCERVLNYINKTKYGMYDVHDERSDIKIGKFEPIDHKVKVIIDPNVSYVTTAKFDNCPGKKCSLMKGDITTCKMPPIIHGRKNIRFKPSDAYINTDQVRGFYHRGRGNARHKICEIIKLVGFNESTASIFEIGAGRGDMTLVLDEMGIEGLSITPKVHEELYTQNKNIALLKHRKIKHQYFQGVPPAYKIVFSDASVGPASDHNNYLLYQKIHYEVLNSEEVVFAILKCFDWKSDDSEDLYDQALRNGFIVKFFKPLSSPPNSLEYYMICYKRENHTPQDFEEMSKSLDSEVELRMKKYTRMLMSPLSKLRCVFDVNNLHSFISSLSKDASCYFSSLDNLLHYLQPSFKQVIVTLKDGYYCYYCFQFLGMFRCETKELRFQEGRVDIDMKINNYTLEELITTSNYKPPFSKATFEDLQYPESEVNSFIEKHVLPEVKQKDKAKLKRKRQIDVSDLEDELNDDIEEVADKILNTKTPVYANRKGHYYITPLGKFYCGESHILKLFPKGVEFVTGDKIEYIKQFK